MTMDTVILEVYDRRASHARIVRACETGKPEMEARIGFASPRHMWQVLTALRWEILQAMCGAGEMGLRALARKVGRDVKSVHTDTRVLLNAGVIDKTDSGKLLFPYRHVKLRVDLDALPQQTTAPPPAQAPAFTAMPA